MNMCTAQPFKMIFDRVFENAGKGLRRWLKRLAEFGSQYSRWMTHSYHLQGIQNPLLSSTGTTLMSSTTTPSHTHT